MTSSAPVENMETCFARTRKIFTPEEQIRFETSYMLSKFAHRHQVRKNELDPLTGKPLRYFEHTRRTFIIGHDIIGVDDCATSCGLILHDSVEDTLLTVQHIRVVICPETAEIVQGVSKVPKPGSFERWVRAGLKSFIVKLADRLQNLQSLHVCDVEFRQKQILETRTLYLPVFEERIRGLEIAAHPWAKGARKAVEMIKDILVREERRLTSPA